MFIYRLFAASRELHDLISEALVFHADVAVVGGDLVPFVDLRGVHDVDEVSGAFWVDASMSKGAGVLTSSHEAHDSGSLSSQGSIAGQARMLAINLFLSLILFVSCQKRGRVVAV